MGPSIMGQGLRAFPPAQPSEVVSAGGLYTGYAPRSGAGIAEQQFKLLFKIISGREYARTGVKRPQVTEQKSGTTVKIKKERSQ
jgi:hypothetical protein